MLIPEEIGLLNKLGLTYNYAQKLTDEQVVEIENKVGDHLTLYCLDDDYNPNEEGKIAYSILDKIDSL